LLITTLLVLLAFFSNDVLITGIALLVLLVIFIMFVNVLWKGDWVLVTMRVGVGLGLRRLWWTPAQL
jgi:hypothetical protein